MLVLGRTLRLDLLYSIAEVVDLWEVKDFIPFVICQLLLAELFHALGRRHGDLDLVLCMGIAVEILGVALVAAVDFADLRGRLDVALRVLGALGNRRSWLASLGRLLSGHGLCVSWLELLLWDFIHMGTPMRMRVHNGVLSV